MRNLWAALVPALLRMECDRTDCQVHALLCADLVILHVGPYLAKPRDRIPSSARYAYRALRPIVTYPVLARRAFPEFPKAPLFLARRV